MSDPTPDTSMKGCLTSLGHWLGWVLLMIPIVLIITVFLGIYAAVMTGGDIGRMGEFMASPDSLNSPAFLGVTTIGQLGLMAFGGALLAAFLPRRAEGDRWPDFSWAHQVDVHALRVSHPAWLVAAAVGTVTVGFLPGWAAARMMEIESLQVFSESMDLIGQTLEKTDDPGWAIFAVAVVGAAPLFEELIFRGYLWRAAQHSLAAPVVWIATSLLFAGYHMNPIHVVAVLPIGLYFGWLRWMSGSVWPGMLGHLINNTWAMVLTLLAGAEAEFGLLTSVVGMCFTLGVSAATWAWVRRSTKQGE